MKTGRWVRALCALGAVFLDSHRADAEQATSSDKFVDSIGVNIHATHYLGFPSTTYDDWNGVIGALNNLGIRYVRDHVIDPNRLNQLTTATGAKVVGILENHVFVNGVLSLDVNAAPTQLAYARQVNGLVAIEGPNEIDQFPDQDWASKLLQYQSSLYTTAKADPATANLPVIAPSIASSSNYTALSGLASSSDRGNTHIYPVANGGVPLAPLPGALSNTAQMVGNKPVWVTEAGYHSSTQLNQPFDFSPTAAAKYMPRMLMDYFNQGIEKTFIYELCCDNVDPTNSNTENNLGLVNADFSLRPAGTAVKNLISLLGDAGAHSPAGSFNYTLTGGNANLHHMLLQKQDGRFYLALWQDVPVFDLSTKTDLVNPDLPVTLSFNGSTEGVNTYLPDLSTSATGIYGNVSQVALSVPDQVMLVEITPTPEPASMGIIACLAGLVLRRRRASDAASRPGA